MSTFLDKGGPRVFFQLPRRHPTTLTGLFVPFIPEPPCQATIIGTPNTDLLVAVGNYGHHIAPAFYGTDTMENPLMRRQKLNPIYEVIQVLALPEDPLLFLFPTTISGDGTSWFHNNPPGHR